MKVDAGWLLLSLPARGLWHEAKRLGGIPVAPAAATRVLALPGEEALSAPVAELLDSHRLEERGGMYLAVEPKRTPAANAAAVRAAAYRARQRDGRRDGSRSGGATESVTKGVTDPRDGAPVTASSVTAKRDVTPVPSSPPSHTLPSLLPPPASAAALARATPEDVLAELARHPRLSACADRAFAMELATAAELAGTPHLVAKALLEAAGEVAAKGLVEDGAVRSLTIRFVRRVRDDRRDEGGVTEPRDASNVTARETSRGPVGFVAPGPTAPPPGFKPRALPKPPAEPGPDA